MRATDALHRHSWGNACVPEVLHDVITACRRVVTRGKRAAEGALASVAALVPC